MKFQEAPRLVINPLGLCGIQSNFHSVLSGEQWVPVCQYPVGYEVDKHEQGMLAKIGADGAVLEVSRRVFSK